MLNDLMSKAIFMVHLTMLSPQSSSSKYKAQKSNLMNRVQNCSSNSKSISKI